jgi:hypothetical protein
VVHNPPFGCFTPLAMMVAGLEIHTIHAALTARLLSFHDLGLSIVVETAMNLSSSALLPFPLLRLSFAPPYKERTIHLGHIPIPHVKS